VQRTSDTQQLSEMPHPIKQAPKWLLISIALALIFWNILWLINLEPDHDEVEHWHAAWLMHQGKVPFYDFFEHHSPLLWMLLRCYYDLFGDHYGIIIASRALMMPIFLLIVLLSYKTARFWMDRSGAWIAALGFPLLSLNYFRVHFCVRGDPIILLLLLAALYYAVRIVKSTARTSSFRHSLPIFILLGIAVAFSPRAGIPSLTLFLTFFFCNPIPAKGTEKKKVRLYSLRLLYFFLGGLIVALPTFLLALKYGIEEYIFWVYYYSASLSPRFSPLPNLINILKSAAPMALLCLVGAYTAIRTGAWRRDRSLHLLGALTVTGIFGLWANRAPYMQHFLMTVPFIGFFGGIGFDSLVSALRPKIRISGEKLAAAALFLSLVLLSVKTYIFQRDWAETDRAAWVECAEWMVRNAGTDGFFAGGTAYAQPIFLQDAFYYWFGGRGVSITLKKIRPIFAPYSFPLLKRRSPRILHESFAFAWGFDHSQEYLDWRERNYNRTPFKGYWIRK
jgi:hypothetical protein